MLIKPSECDFLYPTQIKGGYKNGTLIENSIIFLCNHEDNKNNNCIYVEVDLNKEKECEFLK